MSKNATPTGAVGTSTGGRKRKRKTRSDAFAKLKALPFFDEVERKLKANIAVEEIARWIQEDMLSYDDVKRESLARVLYRYKKTIPPGEFAKAEPLYFQKVLEKLRRGVNEIEELEKLYLLQIHRISKDVQTEDKINKLFPSTYREIQLAADLLDRMVEKKMELGLLSREPTKLNVTGSFLMEGEGEIGDDQKMRLGILAGKLLNALEKTIAAQKKAQQRADEASE